jgi:hypothetical protein
VNDLLHFAYEAVFFCFGEEAFKDGFLAAGGELFHDIEALAKALGAADVIGGEEEASFWHPKTGWRRCGAKARFDNVVAGRAAKVVTAGPTARGAGEGVDREG